MNIEPITKNVSHHIVTKNKSLIAIVKIIDH